jgi:hypothetical protein
MFVGFGRGDTMVIDGRLQHDPLHIDQVRLQRAMVSVCDFGGFDKEMGAALHIIKTYRALKCEFELLGIQQMKCGYIMLAKSQVFKAIFQQGWVHKKVRDNHDQSTLPDGFGKLV